MSLDTTPLGGVEDENGNFSVYYQDNRKRWFKEKFDSLGNTKEQKVITLNKS